MAKNPKTRGFYWPSFIGKSHVFIVLLDFFKMFLLVFLLEHMGISSTPVVFSIAMIENSSEVHLLRCHDCRRLWIDDHPPTIGHIIQPLTMAHTVYQLVLTWWFGLVVWKSGN